MLLVLIISMTAFGDSGEKELNIPNNLYDRLVHLPTNNEIAENVSKALIGSTDARNQSDSPTLFVLSNDSSLWGIRGENWHIRNWIADDVANVFPVWGMGIHSLIRMDGSWWTFTSPEAGLYFRHDDVKFFSFTVCNFLLKSDGVLYNLVDGRVENLSPIIDNVKIP